MESLDRLSKLEQQLLDAGLVPLRAVPNGTSYIKSRCQRCLKVHVISSHQILNQKIGCSFCATEETENLPSYLYVVTNEDLQAIKIGVGRIKRGREERLSVLSKDGWKIVSIWYYESYRDALRLEAIVIFILQIKLNLLWHLQKIKYLAAGQRPLT